MNRKKYDASRRGFLRSAVASAMLSPALIGMGQATRESAEATPTGPDAMLLGRIKLDQEVANQAGVLGGHLRFLRAVSGPVMVRWIDSFGRVSGEQTLQVGPGTVTVPFSFNMRAGLTYVNWIRVTVNGVPQVATAKFMLSPEHMPWNDFHTISWAHYPDGFYDQLRAREWMPSSLTSMMILIPCWTMISNFMWSRWRGKSSRFITRISRNGGRC